MKAHPKATAGPSTHVRSERPRQSRFGLLLRRLAIGTAGLAVAVLAAAACVLSFDDLRALALQAGARENLSYLYPAAFDALLVIALLSFLLLGTARALVRVQAGFVLLVLLAAASWANVSMVMRFTIDTRLGAVIVGVVPWLMLLIGLWLLTLLIKHAQVRRAAYESGADSADVVPFDTGGTAVAEPRPFPAAETTTFAATTVAATVAEPDAPAAAPLAAAAPAHEPPTVVRHEPAVPVPATEPHPVPSPAVSPAGPPADSAPGSGERPRAADPSPEPPSAPSRTEPEEPGAAASDPAGATARHAAEAPVPAERMKVSHLPEEAVTGTAAVAAPAEETASGPADVDAAARRAADEPEPEPRDSLADASAPVRAADDPSPAREESRPGKRPIQWGDLHRSPSGDILVHPGRPQTEGTVSAEDYASARGTALRGEDDATDWEPEETDSGPPETDASSDEAEAVTPETGIPVWPPAAARAHGVSARDEARDDDPPAEPGTEPEAETSRTTQPYPHLRESAEPLPGSNSGQGTAQADPGEQAATHSAVTSPTVPLSPPSGRMRSTPTPPRD